MNTTELELWIYDTMVNHSQRHDNKRTNFTFIALDLSINPIECCLKHKYASPCWAEHKADYRKWFWSVKEQNTGLRNNDVRQQEYNWFMIWLSTFNNSSTLQIIQGYQYVIKIILRTQNQVDIESQNIGFF